MSVKPSSFMCIQIQSKPHEIFIIFSFEKTLFESVTLNKLMLITKHKNTQKIKQTIFVLKTFFKFFINSSLPYLLISTFMHWKSFFFVFKRNTSHNMKLILVCAFFLHSFLLFVGVFLISLATFSTSIHIFITLVEWHKLWERR